MELFYLLLPPLPLPIPVLKFTEKNSSDVGSMNVYFSYARFIVLW